MIIRSMLGLGDNIYQRAFIQDITEQVYLNTPWPELYADLPHVHFVKRETTLRTQAKNMSRQPWHMFERAVMGKGIRVRHTHGGPLQDMCSSFDMPMPRKFTLPSFSEVNAAMLPKPYALIRPVTLRKEWYNASRNCDPSYICLASEILRQQGLFVVSVADLEDGEEWIVGNEPFSHQKFHKGELTTHQLLSLFQRAAIVVGPVGWIVPAGLATKNQKIIIGGGQGGFNNPDLIAPEHYRSEANMTFLAPEPQCSCKEKRHECDKYIPGFAEKFRADVVA